MEIEIKLLLPPQLAPQRLSDWQWPVALTEVAELRLGNRYFDTPDQALRQQDMGLRIRRHGEQRELTLKTAGQVRGGVHARPEYNLPIDSDKPDLHRFPDGLFSPAQLQAWPSQLAAIFATDFVRQRALLQQGDLQLEVALDYGHVVAQGQQEPIAELELELIHGEVAALMPLVAALMHQQPLRLGLDSKAARGYRLAGIQAPAAVQQQWSADAAGVLQAWQRNEERLLAGEASALPPLLRVWQQALPWLTPELAAWLQASMETVRDSAALLACLAQPQYGLAQLQLLTQTLRQAK